METEPSPAQPAQAAANNTSNNNVNTETVIQNINNLSLTGQSNTVNH